MNLIMYFAQRTGHISSPVLSRAVEAWSTTHLQCYTSMALPAIAREDNPFDGAGDAAFLLHRAAGD